MSPAQAERFAERWRVVGTPYNDPVTGVSAIVFEEIATGQKTLAIRGTQGPTDFVANYFILSGIPPQLNPQYVSLKAKVQAWLTDGTLTPGFTVSGHSLGGYLAAGLVADFPTSISHAWLYNAPGNNSVVSQIMQALGIAATPDATKITSLRANAGISPIAALGNDFAPPIRIAIENQFLSDVPNPPAARNHSQQVLTDALAVYALYGALSPALNAEQIGLILRSASERNNRTLENSLDSLRRLLGFSWETATENRNALYANLYALQDSAAYRALSGSAPVRVTAQLSAGQLSAQAKQDFGSFLALQYLLPVAIEGSSSQLIEAHAELYARWQADRAKRIAGATDVEFTDAYLADRAEFLRLKNVKNIRDLPGPVRERGVIAPSDFKDLASGYEVQLRNAVVTGTSAIAASRMVFGADVDEFGAGVILGGTRDDRLYGGGGNDELKGGEGNDYLEGGTENDTLDGGPDADTLVGMQGDDTLDGGLGNDMLDGGPGGDTYIYRSGEGTDTITDSDGLGFIRFFTGPATWFDLRGGKKVGPNLWESDDGLFQYALFREADGSDTLNIFRGSDRLFVKNFSSGVLGITLEGAANPPAPPALVFSLTEESDVVGLGGEDRAVTVLGLGGNDHVGIPALFALPNDPIAQGASVVEGGAGSDAVYAGNGDDRLFGGSSSDLADLLAGVPPVATTDREVVYGQRGDDLLVGGAGADWLSGGRGSDAIYGGAGNDLIAGGGEVHFGSFWFVDGGFRSPDPGEVLPPLQDTLIFSFGIGDVSLTAEGISVAETLLGRVVRTEIPELRAHNAADGADTVLAGAGHDEVWAGYGDDYVNGEAGADTIRGEEGNDTLFGGADPDTLYGDSETALAENQGNDFLDGGDDSDTLIGQGGSDILLGGAGNDTLIGDGESIALAYQGDDYLDGEDGNDILVGGGGNDTLFGGAGNDELQGGLGEDYLDGGPGNDTLFGQEGDDVLLGAAGDDQLVGGAGGDYLDGGEGDDGLFGEDGADVLIGGAGNDELHGGEGDDVLSGGPGRDVLIGGPGDDLYLIFAGDEEDLILDAEGTNRIQFGSAFSPAELRISQAGARWNLAIAHGAAASDAVTVEDGLAASIQEFEFLDGTVHSLKQVLDLAPADPIMLTGEGTGATLYGASNNDTLVAGDFDTLHGGRGHDTLTTAPFFGELEFSRGDGHDLVRGDTQFRTFRFDETVEPASVIAIRADPADPGTITPRDLIIRHGDPLADGLDYDTITVEDTPNSVNQFYVFHDGSSLSHVELLERSGLALDWVGSANDEFVQGTRFDDRLAGGDGSDTLRGGSGDDFIDGGPGDDTLDGDEGEDTLIGGAGNDRLRGGAGNGTLIGGAGSDRLEGGLGDDRYLIGLGDGVDIVTDNAGANLIEFGPGITPENVTAQLVNGTDGNVYLAVGYAPGETVLVQQNFAGSAAQGTIAFRFADGATLSEAELSALKFDAPLNYFGTTEAIRITGSGFDDILIGSTQDDRLEGGEGNDRIAGGAGRDVLIGGAGDDLLVGNAGDDILDGGPGADTYRFHRGMGKDLILEVAGDLNTIALAADLSAGDLARQRIGNALYLHIRNSREGVQIQDYFVPGSTEAAQSWQVTFADGTSVPLEELIGALEETGRPDTLEAVLADFRARAQTFYESALIAAGYRLQADGSFVQETAVSGTFSSSHTARTVTFSEENLASDADLIARQSGQVEVLGGTFSSAQSTRTFQELVTTGSTFVPFASGGNQPSAGGGGATTFFDVSSSQYSGVGYPPGSAIVAVQGSTVTINPLTGAAGLSVSGFRVFPAGTTPAFIPRTVTHTQVERTETYAVNFETIIAGGSDNAITTRPFGIVDAGAGDDTVTGENGLLYVPGEFLGGFFIPEPMPGSPGVLLYGNAGNDRLVGSSADDALIGGTGNDTLIGGPGNDLYIAFAGDGLDEIIEDGANQPGVARENVLRLPQDVTLQDLGFSWSVELRSGRYTDSAFSQPMQSLHSVLTMTRGGGDGARIVIPHAELNVATGLDYVELGDGSRLPFAEILSLAPPAELNPHHLDNDLTGTGAVYGGPGNDVVRADRPIGGAGRDLLIGTDGDDVLIGGLPLDNPVNFVGGAVLGTLWDEGNVFRGGGGDDLIWATAGPDVFEYGLGDGYDAVRDLQHDDFYYYYGGIMDPFLPGEDADALDSVHRQALETNQDILRFGAGIAPSDITVFREENPDWFDFDGSLDYLVFADQSGANGVRFWGWYMTPVFQEPGTRVTNQLARVEFADGTVWDRATIDQLAANAPRLIRGTAEDDLLFGSPFDDILRGFEGSDFLSGGEGNDLLEGGPGDDTYFFDIGFGSDFIEDSAGDLDTINLGEGILPEHVAVTRSGPTLRLSFAGAPDQPRLRQEAATGYFIEQVRFADGTLWDAAALESSAIVEESPPVDSPPPDDLPAEEDSPAAGEDDHPTPADPLPEHGELPSAEGDSLVPPPFAESGGAGEPPVDFAPPVDPAELPSGAAARPPTAESVLAPRAGKGDGAAGIEDQLDALIEDWFASRHDDFIPFGSRPQGHDGAARSRHRGASDVFPHPTRDDIAASWRRTKALLEAHLATSDPAALGADDGAPFFAIPGGFEIVGPPLIGERLPDIAGQPLRRLEGLKEGLAMLAA